MPERVADIHIEKSAGTTMRKGIFEPAFGKSNVLLYHARIDRFRRSSDLRGERHQTANRIKDILQESPLRPFINKLVLQLRQKERPGDLTWEDIKEIDYRIIIGHFTADKIAVLPNHFTTVVLREPLERMYSHYLHWQRSNGATDFRTNIPYSRIAFEQFAMLEPLQNYQSQALADVPLESFDLVGTTERLDLYAQRLMDRLGLDPAKFNLGCENKASNKPPLPVDVNFECGFKEFHKKDYALYEHAVSLENQLQSITSWS